MTLQESIDAHTTEIKEHIKRVHNVWHMFAEQVEISDETFLNINANIENHDKSKFSVEEFDGMRQSIYPIDNEKENIELTRQAWNHHIKNNRHHFEYWLYSKNLIPLEIPFIYMIEMLCDWTANCIQFGKGLKADSPSQHGLSKEELLLHESTYREIQKYLPIMDEIYYNYKE